jgi:hypothetical protein
MKRVQPNVKVSGSEVLSLRQLSRAKNAPIRRSDQTLRSWIERGVTARTCIVHLPFIPLGNGGRSYGCSVAALTAFLDVLQDAGSADLLALGEKVGPPVVYLKGDVFKGMG